MRRQPDRSCSNPPDRPLVRRLGRLTILAAAVHAAGRCPRPVSLGASRRLPRDLVHRPGPRVKPILPFRRDIRSFAVSAFLRRSLLNVFISSRQRLVVPSTQPGGQR
jgi:hypothetical protein